MRAVKMKLENKTLVKVLELTLSYKRSCENQIKVVYMYIKDVV